MQLTMKWSWLTSLHKEEGCIDQVDSGLRLSSSWEKAPQKRVSHMEF